MAGRFSPGRKKVIQSIIIALAGAGLAAGLFFTGWLDSWEAKTWDWRVRVLAEPGPATDDIRLILLDQNSLDWGKEENGLSWPWPREIYSAIISFAQRAGAKALAFDVLYTEPSKYGVEDDQAFGRSIKDFDRFTGAVFLGEQSGSRRTWPKDVPEPSFKVIGLNEWLKAHTNKKVVFKRAAFPIGEVGESASVLSNVHLDPDRDGIYRRVRLFSVFDGRLLPFLGLGTYLAGSPGKTIRLENNLVNIDGRAVRVGKAGEAILRYRGPAGTYKTYSAAAVIQSELRILSGEPPTIKDKNAFKDKYVLFGFSAPGLHDLRPSPVSGVYPGVEINATMLDNFLSNDFIRPFPMAASLALIIILASFGAVSAIILSSPVSGVLLGAAFTALPALLAIFMYQKGFWLNLMVLESASISSVAMAMVVNFATEGRQKRFIKSAFKQYLNPAIIEQLIKNPEKLTLGGERRELSIFFSDLEGFTTISESMDPVELTDLLNEFLSAMTDIIQDEGGTVDKYEGDAIIAFWNAPLNVEDHAERAVRAALRCQKKLAEMRPGIKKRIDKELLMRVGINTGQAVVGNLGSKTRFDYTMLGDSVNLAARLEGVNKQFGTYTMISENTKNNLSSDFEFRQLGRVAVVGKKESVTVYEPMFPDDYKQRADMFNAFGKGLNLFYEGRFSAAAEIFETLKNDDPASDRYHQKCLTMAEQDIDDWDGVWIMQQK